MTVTPPAPLSFFNLKNPNPTTLPAPTTLFFPLLSRRLRFTFVAVRLGSLVGNCLHLGRGVLHLRLAFSVIILDSLTATGTNTEARENQKETKREEIVLTVNH